MQIEFNLGKVEVAKHIEAIEAKVHFKNAEKTYKAESGFITVYLDLQNQTVSEIETQAIKKAKEFLSEILKEN